MNRDHLSVSERAARTSRWGRLEALFLGTGSLAMFAINIHSIIEGRFLGRWGDLLRSEAPVRFWIWTALSFVVAVGIAVVAVARWREAASADAGLRFTSTKRR
jgi:hypothetical protein